MVTPRTRAVRVAVVVIAGVLAFTGCSVTDHVELSTDWSHVIGYTAVYVDDHGYAVGIDPTTGTARALARIPTPPDGESALSGPLSRNSRGQTLVSQPTTSGGAGVYRIDRHSPTATEVATMPVLGPLYPRQGGWLDLASKRGGTQVTLRDSGFAVRGSFWLPASFEMAATDGDHTLCLAGPRAHRYTVTTVDLTTHRAVATATAPAGAQTIACVHAHPLLVYSGPAVAAAGVRRLAGGGTMVSVIGEAAEFVVPDGSRAIVPVDRQSDVLLESVDPTTLKTTPLALLPGVAGLIDAFVSGHTVVVVSDERAATFDLVTLAIRSMPLPGGE